MDNFDLRKYLAENKLLKEGIGNNYVVKSSDEEGDYYYIDKDKALQYLQKFDNDEINAELFVNDDEGWGEFEQYVDDVEQFSNKELEDAMRQEMSYYFFSNPNSI